MLNAPNPKMLIIFIIVLVVVIITVTNSLPKTTVKTNICTIQTYTNRFLDTTVDVKAKGTKIDGMHYLLENNCNIMGVVNDTLYPEVNMMFKQNKFLNWVGEIQWINGTLSLVVNNVYE